MSMPVYEAIHHADLATRVLLVDDDDDTLHVMGGMLELEGYAVTACLSGREAIQCFDALDPHVVILDMRMPAMDGVALTRVLRRKSDVPILMLSALDDEWDASRALESGADDYIRKPVGAGEFVARVRSALRRSTMVASGSTDPITIGQLLINVLEHEVTVAGVRVALTPIELRLLIHLALSENHVLTHDNTLAAVWGVGYAGSRHVLRVTMSRMREKLKLAGAPSVTIHTVDGVGYRLTIEGEAA